MILYPTTRHPPCRTLAEIHDSQFAREICRKTISTAEYAAAAARLSKGLATVVIDTRATKSPMNADITPSLWTNPPRKAKIHSGAISMMSPKLMMKAAMKLSIFSSEI